MALVSVLAEIVAETSEHAEDREPVLRKVEETLRLNVGLAAKRRWQPLQ